MALLGLPRRPAFDSHCHSDLKTYLGFCFKGLSQFLILIPIPILIKKLLRQQIPKRAQPFLKARPLILGNENMIILRFHDLCFQDGVTGQELYQGGITGINFEDIQGLGLIEGIHLLFQFMEEGQPIGRYYILLPISRLVSL